jgi:2-oxoisovalerate dehydrogenase E2 component (dihydrolipoyl transacylase)
MSKSVEFRLPDIGEGLVEAVIIRWLVKVGDVVDQNQPLVEVETAKVLVELPAPSPGRVETLHAEEGTTVSVGALLVTIDAEDDARHATPQTTTQPPTAPRSADGPREAGAGTSPDASDIADPRRPRARPVTRRVARELGVDLAKIRVGTGPAGEVTRADVEAFAAAADGPSDAPSTERRIPLSPVRRRIAERLTASWTSIPHVTEFLDVNVEALLEFRASVDGVSPTALFVKALTRAVEDHPLLNSSLDLERQEIIMHSACHVAVALDTPDGLMVPVVRDADSKSLQEIHAELEDIIDRGRSGSLKPSQLVGSTITLTNMGAGGIHAGTPIINPPEAAIIGVGSFVRRPIVRGEEIAAARCCTIACSFDHRIVDGMEASRFLRWLGDIVENPDSEVA